MSIVIGVCGTEKNVGVTSFSLLLGQAISEILNKATLVVDFDTKTPEIKKIIEKDAINNYNIDNIMTYATVPGTNLETILKSNTTHFINSKLCTILGTNFKERDFTEVQFTNLIQGVRALHEVAIFDFGTSHITSNIYNNIDMLMVMCPASDKYIVDLKNKKDLINKKTEFILNFSKKNSKLQKLFKGMFNRQFYAMLPFSLEVQNNINHGYLNFESGEYKQILHSLVYKLLNKFEIKDKVSKKYIFGSNFAAKLYSIPLFKKLFSNDIENKETVLSENNSEDKEPLLGQILIDLGYLNKEQLDKALSIQAKDELKRDSA